MVRCSVFTCTHQNDNKAKQSLRKFHRFPNDEKLRELWKKLCGRTDDFNMGHARVCSDHFAEELQHTLQCRMLGSNTVERKCGCRIPDGEVPTLYLPTSKELVAQRKRLNYKGKINDDREQIAQGLLQLASESRVRAPPTVNVNPIVKVEPAANKRKRPAEGSIPHYNFMKKLKTIAPAPIVISVPGASTTQGRQTLVLPQGATMVGDATTKMLKGTKLVLPNTSAGTYVNVVPSQPSACQKSAPMIVTVINSGNIVPQSIKTYSKKTSQPAVASSTTNVETEESDSLMLSQDEIAQQLQNEKLEIFSESESEETSEVRQCDTPVDQSTPGTSTAKLSELCRLCALPGGDMVEIFRTDGLGDKINLCLPVKVHESDSLPLQVCRSCVSGVEQSHTLATACLSAQNTLNDIWCHENGSRLVATDETTESTVTPINFCRVQLNTPPAPTGRLIKIPVNLVNQKPYLFQTKKLRRIKPKPAPKPRYVRITQQKQQRIGKVSSKKLPFLCTFCQTVMCSANTAKQHYLKVHKKAICEFCFEVFENNNELISHINSTHLHSCKYCNFKIIGLGESILKNHVNNLHINQRFSTVKKIMKKPGNKKNAIPKTYPLTNKSYIVNCKICSLMFSTRIGLKNHYLSVHKVHSCVSCFKFYNTSAELENHIIEDFHEISCKYCDREFPTNRGLQVHLSITHKDQLPEEIRDPNKIEFDCKICSGIFCSKRNLNRHYVKIHKSYNCNICETICKSKTEFDTHCTTEKHYVCDICDINLTTSENLKSHVESHKSGKNFKCDQCDSKFTGYSNLRHHILYIHMNAPKKYPCKLCSKRYKTPKALQEHLKRHRNEKTVKCPICDKAFYNTGALKIHSEVHSSERKFACEKCKRKFIHQRNLAAHMNSVHASYWEYECKQCESKYKTEIEIVEHVRTHTAEERGDTTLLPFIKKSPFYCDQCDKYFANKIYFSSHKKRHDSEIIASTEDGTQIIIKEKNYCCHICSKQFTFKQSLQVHLKVHLGVRPFQCSLCDKSYFNKAQLIIHVRSHTNERPFPCVICGKAFRSRSSLLLHKRSMHDNLKTIKCLYCDKMFSKQYEVKVHMKIHKNEKPFTCETCGYKCLYAYDMKKHKAGHDYFGYPKFCMFKRRTPDPTKKRKPKDKKDNEEQSSNVDTVERSIEESVELIVGEIEAIN